MGFMSQNSERNRMISRILLTILTLSVGLRVAAAFYIGNDLVEMMPGTADQISYHTLAQRVLTGNGFTFDSEWWPATAAGSPTAHWSFLYTFFIMGVYALVGVQPVAARLVQATLIGILHPWLVYLISRRLFGDISGLIAAGITAVYAYFIYYSATLMTEPFYITAILASFYITVVLLDQSEIRPGGARKLAYLGAMLGFVLGGAVLLRQLFLLIIPLLFLWAFWVGGRKVFLPLLLSGTVVLAMILPFTYFNFARFHRFVLLNTNAGYALYFGNHPSYGTKFIPILPPYAYVRMIPKELRSLDEAALDQALLGKSIEIIAGDPIRYLKLSISRIPAYFTFWPSPESGLLSNLSRMASFGLFLPFMVYGLFLAMNKRQMRIISYIRNPITLLILFVLFYTLIHLLTWTLIRYRLPVDAVLIIFAGYSIFEITRHFKPFRPLGPLTQVT